METTPGDVIALIRRHYPKFEDHTNIGSSHDLSQIAGIVAAMDAIPNHLIPSELRAAFIEVRGRFQNAVLTWRSGGLHNHYLSGRDLRELLGILAEGVNVVFTSYEPSGVPEPENPLVFISCGQYTSEEVELGKALEQIVRETGKYEGYFAEQQNSLEGLSSHILSSLERCAGFVAVAHHRGKVIRSKDEIVRASVWVEQEIAIAAFIQQALKRRIEVALYLQKGIQREGIREQLRLAPIEFETSDDVLRDFHSRLLTWNLETPREYSLMAEWRFERVSHKQHGRENYKFMVDLVNNGTVQVTDWRVRVEFPKQFVDAGSGSGNAVIEEDSSRNSLSFARLYPGQRLESVISVAYNVNESSVATIRADEPTVELWLASGDMRPAIEKIPMSKLNKY